MTVTYKNLCSLDLESVISKCKHPECFEFYKEFRDLAGSASEKGSIDEKKSWQLLADLCLLSFHPSNRQNPFSDRIRPAENPLAFLDAQAMEVLGKFFPEVSDPELRARISDINWTATRNVDAAHSSIDAYLESASLLEDPKDWVACSERLERAARLAVMLRDESQIEKVFSRIEETVYRLNGEDPLFLTDHLMTLLLEFGRGDAGKMAAIAEKAARKAQDNGNWRKARSHWDACANWENLRNEDEACFSARIAAAETYVEEAAAAKADNRGALVAAHFLGQAIEAYRRIGGQQSRVDDLYRELRKHQTASLEQMQQIETEGIDISEVITTSRKHVSGRSKFDALLKLAFLTAPPDYDQLQKRANELAKQFPLQNLFGGVVIDKDGRVIARRPSLGTLDPQEDKQAVWMRVVEQANIAHEVKVVAELTPARQQVIFEHNITDRDFDDILSNNPLIPTVIGRDRCEPIVSCLWT